MWYKVLLLCSLLHIGTTDDRSTRIAGGLKVSDANEYKFIVSLRKNNVHFCSGVIITTSSILTTASCIGSLRETEIVAYSNTLLTTGGTPLTIKAIIVHKKYDISKKEFNIAVLKTNSIIPATSGVPIQMLDTPENFAQTKEFGVVSGWGFTLEEEKLSPDLLETTVKIITKERCQQYMSTETITDNMICTYQLYRDACEGDEGGPLLVHSGGRKLAGIVSWGVGCGYPRKARVYVNIPALYKDITDMTK